MIVVSIDKVLNLGVEIFHRTKTHSCVAFPPSCNPQKWNTPSTEAPNLINELMMTDINVFKNEHFLQKMVYHVEEVDL